MLPTLSLLETRVLGVLAEKQRTVPDTYPLTLNSLLSGCNQNRSRTLQEFCEAQRKGDHGSPFLCGTITQPCPRSAMQAWRYGQYRAALPGQIKWQIKVSLHARHY